MPRPRAETLTGREAQVMDVLWTLGAATAEQVRAALPDRPHDSTVRTLLRVLESKGHAVRDDRGTSYTYRPAVDRPEAQRHALRELLGRLFGGSAEALVLRLLEDEAITPAQLEEISATVHAPRTPASPHPDPIPTTTTKTTSKTRRSGGNIS